MTPTVLLFWICLFLLTLVNCSAIAFPPLGNLDHVVVSVSIDFMSNKKGDVPFRCVAYDYSHTNWDGVHDHLRDIPLEDILPCFCRCY